MWFAGPNGNPGHSFVCTYLSWGEQVFVLKSFVHGSLGSEGIVSPVMMGFSFSF